MERIFYSIAYYFLCSNKILLMVQQNYFQICIQQNFRSLSKIVLFVLFLKIQVAVYSEHFINTYELFINN